MLCFYDYGRCNWGHTISEIRKYSQYLNQATAFMYMIMSTLHMAVINKLNAKKGLGKQCENTLKKGHATVQTSPTKQTPWYFLVVIGVINGTSNTFSWHWYAKHLALCRKVCWGRCRYLLY